MSMDRCRHCDRLVDTDDFDAYEDGEFAVCESCRERLYAICETCERSFYVQDDPADGSPALATCPKCTPTVPPGDAP